MTGSPKAATLPSGSYHAHRVGQATFARLVTMTYGYDAAGNITSATRKFDRLRSNDPAATINRTVRCAGRLTG